MTVKQSIINFLNTYDKFTIDEFVENEIATENGYAISKLPTKVVDSYIDGTTLVKEYYTFIANLKLTLYSAFKKCS